MPQDSAFGFAVTGPRSGRSRSDNLQPSLEFQPLIGAYLSHTICGQEVALAHDEEDGRRLVDVQLELVDRLQVVDLSRFAVPKGE